jgi:Bacterial PH domain
MTNETFRPTIFVHLIGIGLPVFMAHLAYRSSIDEFVNGGLPLRIVLVGSCIALAILTLWLYARSGLLVYSVTDAGLELRRLMHRRVIPWDQITEVRWNRPLHYFTILGSDGVISFTSTDGFPNAGDFLDQVHQRSQCKLPEHLRAAMYGSSNL